MTYAQHLLLVVFARIGLIRPVRVSLQVSPRK